MSNKEIIELINSEMSKYSNTNALHALVRLKDLIEQKGGKKQ